MKKIFFIVLVAMFVFGISGTAKATVLAPGGFGTITNAYPSLWGSSVWKDSSTVNFSFSTVSGIVTQNVYLNSTGYLFVYDLRNSLSSADSIGEATVTTFTGFNTEVDGYGTGLDKAPYDSFRSISGGTIGWDYRIFGDAGLMPGMNSYTMWVQTDAQFYGPGQIHLINGGTHDVNLFGPAVPEPNSFMLLGMGILGLFGLGRRKRV